MKFDKQLFRSDSFLIIFHAAGFILLLFGIYSTVFHLHTGAMMAPEMLGVRLFDIAGGWVLLGGFTLDLIAWTGLRNKRKKTTILPSKQSRFPM